MTTIASLENVEDVYPLTPMQQGMLFHTLADQATGVFVNQMSVTLEGGLEPDRFRSACNRLIERHETLRTAFLWDGLDQPLQVVRDACRLEWIEHDWSEHDDDRRRVLLDDLLAEDRGRTFDLADAPLTRMALIRCPAGTWEWVWTTHHLIADGWSLRVMLEELFADYRGELRPDAARTFRYRDFVALTNRSSNRDDEVFWRAALAGFDQPHRLEVPGLPADASGHRAHVVKLGKEASEALAGFARNQRVTLNTATMGAWGIALSRWMRSRDVLFGVTSSGRDPGLPGVERGVGLFINTLPLRIDVAPEATLGSWLRDLQGHQSSLRAHELSSLASVQRWSDVEPGVPLFESIFVFESVPGVDPGQGKEAPTILGMQFSEHSNYPLAILVHPGEQIAIRLIYDRSKLSDDAVRSLGQQMIALLEGMPQAASARVAQLGTTTEADAGRLAAWGTGADLDPGDVTMVDLIAAVAERTPERVAVVFGEAETTYGELWEAAGVIADQLMGAGVGPNRLVGLLLSRSVEMLIGMLGILRSGGAYVPIDPEYPINHISKLLETDGVGHVVTDDAHRRLVPRGITVVDVNVRPPVPVSVGAPTSADDLAYVIHTSGSTGTPKGVGVSHRNLVCSTLARGEHYDGPVGRFLLLSSFAFDSSVVGLFWTLSTGGALVLPDAGRGHDADHLLTLMNRRRVTHLLCLPSLYQLLLDHDSDDHMASLRVAIIAGEACPPGLLATHLRHLPTTQLHNEYGPTEATVWCTVHEASPSDVGGPLPIGRPIAGARIYLLDEHGNQTPCGFVGEICVAGEGLTAGYRARPDLTAERFVTIDIGEITERVYRTGDLAYIDRDGALQFLGRADTQLKVRGYRIEPGAVEAALRSHEAVADAAVTGRSTRGRSATQLIAYVVAANPNDGVANLRQDMQVELPRHMVPDLVVAANEIPRLPNGKIDYGRLPDPATRSQNVGGFVAPRDDTEATLAKLWAEFLGADLGAIGADADFFALGGDSLIAIRLTSAVHREFGVAVPLSSLLDAPRLGEFADLLRRRPPESRLLVPIRGSGPDVLFMIHPGGGNVLAYEPVARHLPESITAIGIQARGVEGVDEPDRSIERMAMRYAEAIDEYQPTGAINVVGYSTGGLVAFETARVLERRGRSLGMVAMLDTLYPLGKKFGERAQRQANTVQEGGFVGIRTVLAWWWATIRGTAGRFRHGPKWRYLSFKGRSLPLELAGKRINHIALRAQRGYEPGPYGGAVTYLRAAGDEGRRYQHSQDLWRSVAADVVVREAPGRHTGEHSMVIEPHAAEVARILAEELKRVSAMERA